MNRKYYIVLQYQRKGPFNIEELKKQNITKDTLIWTFELNNPVKAGDLPELNSIWTELENNKTNEDVPPPPPPDLTETPLKEEQPTDQPVKEPETNEDKPPLFDDNNLPKFDDENTPPPLFDNNKPPEEETPPTPSQEPEEDNITSPPIPDDTTNKKEPTTPPPPPPPIITQTTSQTNDSSQETSFSSQTHKKPNDYIIWSILSLVLCCNLISIGSLVTGIQCKNKYIAGQYEEAEKLSKTTLLILIIGTALTALSWIFLFTTNDF